ncbi:pyridoxamine kinase [Sphaerochaeta sp. PS]|uniref:pyridoxamine kinase n=1 Tax=Sphaerochaeta sp. PS TaxID=3076336 RepID=UPI0028A34D3E|nr:pyridoxamine kinase [Sphaerochaeta sp. PS]MDT4762289.1 pyridoxamine kinase [Sphaerochaeta sp. PS]
MIPTCAAFHDLCSYSKSSLTVVMPTLEVLGIEACPLPTALLSTQTDGFDHYHFEDNTETLTKVLTHWDALDLRFDSIYSGFLGSYGQVEIVRHFIDKQRATHNPLVVVDPVLGDWGKPYDPVDAPLIEAMRSLVLAADLITPNTTEAALLLDRPMQDTFSEDEILLWARELSELAGSWVTITSVPIGDAHAVAHCHEGECGLVYYENLASSYPGCGDLFASMMTGFLLSKVPFQTAVEKAVAYSTLAIDRTLKAGYERRHGIAPSLIFPSLIEERAQYGS